MQASTVSRRGFIGLGAATAAGVAALASQPATARADLASDATGLVPSFFTAPEPPADADVAETVDVDVCVVGVGLAGVCALREAAEQGATVIGIEKSGDVGYRSGEFGTFGSKIHETLGIEQPPTHEVVNELMRVMGNRPNARLLNYWIGKLRP